MTHTFMLDFIRGVSALVVCVSHLRAATWLDMKSIESPHILEKVFWLVTGLGHQAVVVFFVVSGYLVGGSVLASGKSFSFRRYAVRRLTRLWVVLIPSLIFTYIVGLAAEYFYPGYISYPGISEWHSVPSPVEYSDSLLVFFGNVFFLQTILVPTYGLNGPLWSLSNEFWYYVLFPLIWCVLSDKYVANNRFARMAYGIAAVLIITFLPTSMLFGFICWLIGALAWYIRGILPNRLCGRFDLSTAAWAVLVLQLIASKAGYLELVGDLDDVLLALSVGMVIIVVPNRNADSDRTFASIVASRLAGISYSLYLFHFPVVVLIGLFQGNRLDGGILYLYFILHVAIIVLVGWIAWYLFERRTDDFRFFFENRVAGLFLGGNK